MFNIITIKNKRFLIIELPKIKKPTLKAPKYSLSEIAFINSLTPQQ